MISKICPKCNRIMSYDPYFKANICRQCGATEQLSAQGVVCKRISRIKSVSSRHTLLTR